MPLPGRSASGPRDGVALIVALVFIALLSILIVSFVTFSRFNSGATASYSKSIQAEEIAQGGIQDVLADLRQEIVAGSVATTTGTNTIYVPTTNLTATPIRLGYNSSYYGTDLGSTNLPPTLVRVSRASQDATPTDLYPVPANAAVYTGGTLPLNYASAANSSTNSANGRYISALRWNKIALLTTNSTSASYLPQAFSTNTPDWVYVTRAGRSIVTTGSLTSASGNIKPSNNLTNTAPVIGRYAYAVYNEGALLDVNVAGALSAAGNAATYATNVVVPSTNNPALIAGSEPAKSYLAYADLTQLPGLSGAQTTVIDPLITWRNGSTSFSGSAASTNFFQMVYNGASTGYLNFQTNDSPILSRQDLINYFAKIDSSGTTYSQALPYLGTFSRAVTAPSWTAQMDSVNLPGYYGMSAFTNTAGYGSPVPYKTGQTSTSANRDVPNVRYPTGTPAGTLITHYDDFGNATTYTVSPGNLLVQHRFSLAKLAWLTYKGPSADLATTDPLYNAGGTDANIQACFGLAWKAQSANWGTLNQTYGDNPDEWTYVAATTTNVHILSLGEVAAGATATANPGYREPNFFEMLNAGILSGSIGQSPGPVYSGTLTNPYEGVMGKDFDLTSVDKTKHILQIGANIIDQSDTDSFPTAIYLKEFTAATLEADLSYNTVFGDENLPGITRVCRANVQDPFYTKTTGTATALQNCFKAWHFPELWNIHQQPAKGVNLTVAGTPGYPYPTQLRLHAYGKSYVNDLYSQAPISYTGSTTPVDYDNNSTGNQFYDSSGNLIPAGSAPTGAQAAIIYVNEGANAGTAASAFYAAPFFLQWTGTAPTMFGWSTAPTTDSASFTANQTIPLNLFISPNYNFMPEDSSAESVSKQPTPNSNTMSTVQFAAFFAGEDSTVPDLSPITSTTGTLGSGDVTLKTYIGNPLTVSVEAQDAAGHWHPGSLMSRMDVTSMSDDDQIYLNGLTPDNAWNYYGTPGSGHAMLGCTNLAHRGEGFVRPDPRTDRFSVSNAAVSKLAMGHSMEIHPNYVAGAYWPTRSWGFVYAPTPNLATGGTEGSPLSEGSWAFNSTQPYVTTGTVTYNAFYVDPDGVIRPGDGFRGLPYQWNSPAANATSGDGRLTYVASTTTAPASTLPSTSTTSPKGSAQARRPVILNRPFRSVAELGYTFRDVPYKSIDFSSAESGDGALLDLFSIRDEPAVSAGQVDLNAMPVSAVTAILSNTLKMEINDPVQSTNFISSTSVLPEAKTCANALATALNSSPLQNRSDLVRVLDPIITSTLIPLSVNSNNYRNKAYAEAPIRALSGVANTRTWNLLIDVIAQSGNMSPTAATLNDFIVQGERRYWLHIAIDRYTGKIIDQQLETVYE